MLYPVQNAFVNILTTFPHLLHVGLELLLNALDPGKDAILSLNRKLQQLLQQDFEFSLEVIIGQDLDVVTKAYGSALLKAEPGEENA